MPKRVDSNQPAIVQALRQAGCSVALTHMVGRGFPDVVVGRQGLSYLLEIKDGDLPPSKRRLTPDEERWHADWDGHVCIVESIEDALAAVGLM